MCERFSFKCPSPSCDTVVKMDSPFRGSDSASNLEYALESCPNPKCSFPIYSNITSLYNRLQLDIRRHILKYYHGWLICEDPACDNRTRKVPQQFIRGLPICNLCERGFLFREYSDRQLYKQLNFYHYIFDLSKASQNEKNKRFQDAGLRKAYNQLSEMVHKCLQTSSYARIDLTRLFQRGNGKQQSCGE